ncbi:MAG: ATP-binding protein [Bacteroidetes bacterium]|uniref:ATP-binding protein n=1 Tax=Candidatus Gallipaludibacter merdavium TaxID=2840839 RepID=A0A9D9HVD2_9BACT|nr:ATP-binding protein [Candidatus Gallipaludibacter merdavium]
MTLIEIEKVLLEQQDELQILDTDVLIHRSEEDLINLKSKLAQVVIGVRRSGKSTLCFNALRKAGVNFAYANFDDERLMTLKTSDLDNVLQSLYKIYGEFDYLFLDEIQNIDGWPLFVNRLLRQKIHLLITGSNAKLLSTELSSHLTGRYHKIELFPFSFRDWCIYKNLDYKRLTTKNKGLLSAAYDDYFHQGGFPELISGIENPKEYISTLIDNILAQDIQKRYNIRNMDALKRLAHHILNETPTLIVKDTLQRTIGIKSERTISNYLLYLNQTYLLSTINKYSTKSRERTVSEKSYAIDVSFMDKRENAFSGDNLGWRLETVVYLELLRRKVTTDHDIYYFQTRSAEADFVVCNGNLTLAVYQVSYDISNPKTRKREINGCIAAAKVTKCNNLFLITDHEQEMIQEEGYTIQVVPIWEWLINI